MNRVSQERSQVHVRFLKQSVIGVAALLSACAGTTPPVEPKDEPIHKPTQESTSAKAAEPEPELSDEAAALIAESEGKAPPPKSDDVKPGGNPSPVDSKTGHELTYRVKPDSLLIQVAGASFIPKAKSKKLKNGFGVEIELEAKSDSGVILAQSDSGPMALAAQIAGKKEVIGDKRTEGPDKTVTTPTLFRRSWPSDEASALKPGDVAEIQVGLWGLGTSESDKKPVRRFFVINVKVDPKGAAVTVAPPKGTGK